MHGLENLGVKIFADGADKDGMLNLYGNPLIKGLTTNPTLMRKAGIQDYESFARDILIADTGKDPEPIMRASKELLGDLPKTELLGASVREVLN